MAPLWHPVCHRLRRQLREDPSWIWRSFWWMAPIRGGPWMPSVVCDKMWWTVLWGPMAIDGYERGLHEPTPLEHHCPPVHAAHRNFIGPNSLRRGCRGRLDPAAGWVFEPLCFLSRPVGVCVSIDTWHDRYFTNHKPGTSSQSHVTPHYLPNRLSFHFSRTATHTYIYIIKQYICYSEHQSVRTCKTQKHICLMSGIHTIYEHIFLT